MAPLQEMVGWKCLFKPLRRCVLAVVLVAMVLFTAAWYSYTVSVSTNSSSTSYSYYSSTSHSAITSVVNESYDSDDIHLSLSPILRDLDAVSLTRDGPRSVDAGDCSSSVSRAELTEEPLRWQPVATPAASAFVFSAFYDRRWNPPVVIIIGIASEYTASQSGPRQRYCRMWFRGETKPKTVSAYFRYVPETHGRKYAAAFYTCSLSPSEPPPHSVSLVSGCSNTDSNLLKVIDPEQVPASSKVLHTVCLSVLHSNYSDYRRLIETVELSLMLGANRFIVYDLSSSPDVRLVLESYRRDGIIDIVPWNSLPVGSGPEWPPNTVVSTPEVHYFGQVAALNDCLYRSLFRSTFILFTDVDEIVVPRHSSFTSGDGWSAMLDRATRDRPSANQYHFPGVYTVRNVFFRPESGSQSGTLSDWLAQDSPPITDCGVTVKREDYVYPYDVRSKYFVWSKAAVMIGIHFPYEVIDSAKVKTVYVEEKTALLHHYRPWSNLDDPRQEPKIITDRWMDRYVDNVTHRIDLRRRAILDSLRTTSRH